jgi:hypothetical protein
MKGHIGIILTMITTGKGGSCMKGTGIMRITTGITVMIAITRSQLIMKRSGKLLLFSSSSAECEDGYKGNVTGYIVDEGFTKLSRKRPAAAELPECSAYFSDTI